MPCPVNNLQGIVKKMAGGKVEITEIKLTLFGRHQKKKKCAFNCVFSARLTLPLSTHTKLGFHRLGLWPESGCCQCGSIKVLADNS